MKDMFNNSNEFKYYYVIINIKYNIKVVEETLSYRLFHQ